MRTLEENEAIIEKGLQSFIEVGEALKEIRDNKQYEKRYGTGVGWASYLKQRWDMTTEFARQLILAAEAVANLKIATIVVILPDKETQVRELRKAPKEKQPEVWNAAVQEAQKQGRKQPTIKEVAKEVSKVKSPKPKMTEEQKEAKRIERIEAKALDEQIRRAEILGPQLLVWEKVKDSFLPEFEDLMEKTLDQLEESEWLPFRFALSNYIEGYKRKGFKVE